MRCTRVPVPPHRLHSERFDPFFNPLPTHVLHLTKGVITISFFVPFAASINETVVCTSILSPTRICSWKGPPRAPPPLLASPPNALNKSSKEKSAPNPPPKPENGPAPAAPPKGPPGPAP